MSTPVIAHRMLSVLRVSDPRVLDEIRAMLPLDDYVLGVLSATELIIDPARLSELSMRLSERGLPPLMKRAPGGGGDETTLPRGR